MDGVNRLVRLPYNSFLFVFLFALFTRAEGVSAFGPHWIEGHFAEQKCEGFLPPNKLSIPDGPQTRGQGVTEQEFNSVIGKIENEYKNRVAALGGTLKIQREWQNAEVNAFALRQGRDYIVRMMGGLARHQYMTADGFALVLCHEIGHHIGGVPRYSDAQGQWASVEGQSDYFATLKCFRHAFLKEDNEALLKGRTIPARAKELCEQSFNNGPDQWLCQRAALASLDVGKVFSTLGGARVPDLATPDQNVVNVTYEKHPQAQCRVDTYFAGAHCLVDENEDIGQSNANVGVCIRGQQAASMARPLCWFKDASNGNPGPNPNPNPNPNPGPGHDRPLTPNVAGQSQVQTNRPDQVISIGIDARPVSGATGFLIEVSKPNQVFTNPGGNTLDPVGGLGYQAFRGTFGSYSLLPARQLPGYGTYQIRLLALDNNGRPVGRFSDVMTLMLVR